MQNSTLVENPTELNPSAQKRTPAQTAMGLFCLLFVIATPEAAFAAAAPWENTVNAVIGFLNGGLTRSVGILIVMGLGFMAWSGKLTMGVAVKVIIGFVFVFGAAAIADLFIGSV